MIPLHRSTLVAVALAAGLAVATACGPRQVEVRTAPPAADTLGTPSVQLTNNLSQAVNVYVNVSGGTEMFLRQVPANTVEKVPVNGVAKGSTVSLWRASFRGRRTSSGPFVFSPNVTAARPSGRGTSVRLGAA
jgi:hypothetical protein